MIASYTATGLPTLSSADPRLENCCVETRAVGAAPVVEEYALPGLSGRGVNAFGLDAGAIEWDVSFEATPSNVQAFETDLRAHLRAPVRGALQSEKGETWNYVELRRAERAECRPAGSGKYWVRMRLGFRWMQP